MKLISERKALVKLKVIKDELRADVAKRFEHRAKSCETCETPGACCLDAHFVNVHVSRLEAEAMLGVLGSLPAEKRNQVYGKIVSAIERYGLTSDSGSFDRTYACPLFEPGIGCLVHDEGKPVPCIIHACYENAADLPPEEIQSAAELDILALNKRTYGHDAQYLPIPLALTRA